MEKTSKMHLKEAFKKALDEGWVFVAANVYSSDNFRGVAAAIEESRAAAIIQSSSDTYPGLAHVYCGLERKDICTVNDLLRGVTLLSSQRKATEILSGTNSAIYLAVDHSNPLSKIFQGDERDMEEYIKLIKDKDYKTLYDRLTDSISEFYKAHRVDYEDAFKLQKTQTVLDPDKLIRQLTKYLLFTEKLIMSYVDESRGIDVDIDYVALDLDVFPKELNIALTKVVTEARDYYHEEEGRKYVCVESGFGIEGEKKKLDSDEQEEYARSVIKYVRETNVDAVSCNIGTYHGEMEKGKIELEGLHVISVQEITAGLRKVDKGDVIIVAHGGSSITDEALPQLAKYGLVKVNKASVFIESCAEAIRDYLNKNDVFDGKKFNRGKAKAFSIQEEGMEAISRRAKNLFDIAGSVGKASEMYRLA